MINPTSMITGFKIKETYSSVLRKSEGKAVLRIQEPLNIQQTICKLRNRDSMLKL